MPQRTTNNPQSARTVEELTAQNVSTILKLEREAQAQRSASDRIATFVTRFCANLKFVLLHVVCYGGWIGWNSFSTGKHFDPFPFPLLTLCVSFEAILLSIFILISANHHARISERRNHLNLQITLLTEQENTKMLTLLKEIAERVGVIPGQDPTIDALEQATRPEKLLEQIDEHADDEQKQKQSGARET